MRITFVVHQFPPRYFTGTETYALAGGTELRRRGHDVDVFTLDPAFGESTGAWRESRETVEGLPVRRLNYWMRVAPDWVTAECRHPLMAATFARHLAERRRRDRALLARRQQRRCDEPSLLARHRAAVRPSHALAAAVDEFETLNRGAAAR